jgi:hypothetical protein
MRERTEKPAKLLLQEQLLQLCTREITEEGLLTMKSLIDNFLYKRDQKYTDELAEEFGSVRYDFDEWLHDPGK